MNSIVESVDATYDAAGRLRTMSLQDGLATHSFDYDSLGRMVFATDPDIGDRHLLYDDRGFLIEHTNGAGQTVTYDYDGAGRLTSVLADDGSSFTYHYDTARDPATYEYTAGRLAWIEEITGTVDVGYDAYGRQVRFQRTIVDEKAGVQLSAEERNTFAPSGLLRQVDFRDGLVVDVSYDDAGRPIQVGDLWFLDEYDDAGRIVREHFGNGVTQRYEYDENGQTRAVAIHRPETLGGAALYDVLLARNAYGAITSVTDRDGGAGLDHTAAFGYDGAARLTDAILGSTPSAYTFSYRYDGLQNMTERVVTGPASVGSFQGDYHYGPAETRQDGTPFGPRQLARVTAIGAAPGDPAVATFDYDAAGRQTTQNDLTLTYNGLDQLTSVDGLPDGAVHHAYGYDGFRVLTRSPDGTTQYWFTPGVSERDGIREHYVRLGDRIIARVDQAPVEEGGGGTAGVLASGARAARTAALALLALCLALLGYALTRPRRRFAASLAATLVATTLAPSCGWFREAALWRNERTIYFHQGVGAGPSVFTRPDGSVLEERRYEPFGEDLDAYRELEGGGSETGEVSFTTEAHNVLNKQTDPSTGWSYHAARWMAPETGRWLTPDPPVKAPNPRYLATPWSLHPYQYVEQNPISYWDPSGLDKVEVGGEKCISWSRVRARLEAREERAAKAVSLWGGGPNGHNRTKSEEEDGKVAYANRHRDLKRGIAIGKVTAAAVAPEAYAVGSVLLDAGEAITGNRWLVGRKLSGAERDAATGRAVFGVLFLGMASMGGQNPPWTFGGFKSISKWQSQMAKRGWTPAQITEAMQNGQRFQAQNLVNTGNTATRYVHPDTGRSVVIDDVTKEVLHVGGDGFKY